MTIHTFSVSAMLTNETYYNIQKDLKIKDPSKWKALKNGMYYWGLSDKGILINMHQVKKKGFYTYYIIYRISARRVIENNNYVGLFNVKNYYDLEETVNNVLKEKCEYMPNLNKCKLKRLDFCINAKLDNQAQVKAYIKTIKKANVPANLEVVERYDKRSKRKKPNKDEFTIGIDDYIEISIYNKYMEMKKEKEQAFPKSEIERAKNIVRIEIRCKEGKIKSLKKKYNVESIAGFMSCSNKIGKELYKYYLSKILSNGEICTLKESLNRIDNSGYKKDNISLLKEFIRDSNESRSVAETIKMYNNIYDKTKVKKIVSMLDDINTNFLTITNKDVKMFEFGYVPTPLELYKEFVK